MSRPDRAAASGLIARVCLVLAVVFALVSLLYHLARGHFLGWAEVVAVVLLVGYLVARWLSRRADHRGT